ncbi:methyltransferase domain-containing protein [Frankia sp. CiP3]|uniref:methyltransferase domain-containing protein n=1 Tax=Frankia sp. CiP3 TaxID=2880971 RepID=UPI001EF51AA6|nr:methyltransferase domain-containing protein [Frankia sp. CiP3]
MLRWLEDEGRASSPAEQVTLARWSGWGALPGVFDEANEQWSAERAALRDADAWRAAQASTLNAHYTDAALVRVCWDLLEGLGFTGGRVLEPGCGSGNFIGLAPNLPIDIIGVEVDPTTARIAAALYPDADIRMQGFEDTRLPMSSFDAVVGNFPFGNYPVFDPVHNPARRSIHNHFAIKSLDLLKPGGILIAITSSFTMDARNPAARRDIQQRADLLGAIRLPSKAHAAAAGTDVVTDILVLRRRPSDAEPALFTWEDTVEVDLPAESITPGHPDTVRINRYFVDRPEAVLGRLGVGGPYSATVTAVVATDDWKERLAEQAGVIRDSALLAGQGWSPRAPEPATRTAPAADLDDGGLTIVNGKLMVTGAGGTSQPVRTRNRAEAAELQVLVELRDTARLVLSAQASDDPADTVAWTAALRRLNDAYRTRFGALADAVIESGEPDGDEVERVSRVPRGPAAHPPRLRVAVARRLGDRGPGQRRRQQSRDLHRAGSGAVPHANGRGDRRGGAVHLPCHRRTSRSQPDRGAARRQRVGRAREAEQPRLPEPRTRRAS